MSDLWETPNERTQRDLARAALDRAIGIVTSRAEVLAGEMENGGIANQGGVEALRLFATLTRNASLTTGDIYIRIAHGRIGHC